MLTDADKINARRFMGYPVFGSTASSNAAWLSYQAAGLLEYRLGHLTTSEETILKQYLGTLATLEGAIPEASADLDTQSAGVWVRNPLEMKERTRLFDDWRRRLCGFLGVPTGPEFPGGNSVRLVV